MTGPLAQTGLIILNILLWGFFVVSSTILVVIAVPIRLLTEPFDPNLRILQQYSCFWGSLYLWFNPFWSLTKKGLGAVDRRKAYVIVSNHQSMADILVLFNTFLHFKWVSKRSLFKFPLLGWNMRLNRYVPVDRGNAESREECLRQCRIWLGRGSSILFFPEGTRSKDGRLLPFRPGAFRLALETARDVLPIVIKGSLDAIPKHSILLHRRSRMILEVLPPVSVAPFRGAASEEGAARLSLAVRAQMERRLKA